MKKRIIAILSLITAFVMCFALVACGGDDNKPNGGGGGEGGVYTVTFDPNGGTLVGSATVKTGADGKLAAASIPTATHATLDFGGWYTERDGGVKVDGSYVFSHNDTVYAKWSDGETPTPPTAYSVTLDEALTAFGNMFDAEGWVGGASCRLKTANTEAMTDNVSLDKRGNKVKMTFGDKKSMIYDLVTGYYYESTEKGYYASSGLSANIFGFAEYFVNANFGDTDTSSVELVCDKDTKTAKYTYDAAEQVNDFLAPLVDAYEHNDDIEALLDALVAKYVKMPTLPGMPEVQLTFDDLYQSAVEMIRLNKNTTVAQFIAQLKLMGLDIEAMIADMGYTIPEEISATFETRKLGEMIVGFSNSLATIMNQPPMGMTDIFGMAQQLGMELVNGLFFAEANADDLDAVLKSVDDMLKPVLALNVKTLVDMTAQKFGSNDFYLMVSNGVQFKNIKCDVVFGFDDDKNLMSLSVNGIIEHDFDQTAPDWCFLADNKYEFEAKLDIDEYSDVAPEDFVINFAPDADYRMAIDALVYELDGKDISVYYESCGKNIVVSDIMVFVGDSDKPVEEEVVTFDATKNLVVFDGEFVKATFENAVYGDEIVAVLFFGDDNENGYGVTLIYANADMEQMFDYAVDSVLEFIGIGDPDISVKVDIDGTYYLYAADNDGWVKDESGLIVIDGGEIVQLIDGKDDLTSVSELYINKSQFAIVISPWDEVGDPYTIVVSGEIEDGVMHATYLQGLNAQDEVINEKAIDVYLCLDGKTPPQNVESANVDGKYYWYSKDQSGYVKNDGHYVTIENGELIINYHNNENKTVNTRIKVEGSTLTITEDKYDLVEGPYTMVIVGTVTDGVYHITAMEAYDEQGELIDSIETSEYMCVDGKTPPVEQPEA